MDEWIYRWLPAGVGSVALWLGGLHTKVRRNEKDIDKVLTKLDEHAEQRTKMLARQVRIETKLDEGLHILKNGNAAPRSH